MGTHPIFESDFDCLTEVGMSVVPNVQLSKDRLDALYADIQKLDTAETEVKVRIKPISPLLACHLCSGYLVNATAITECLHVFCRSCLIKHLQMSQECPDCGEKVIISAEGSLRLDRTLQVHSGTTKNNFYGIIVKFKIQKFK